MNLAARILLAAVFAVCASATKVTHSQAASEYPSRPITIIVPAPVGGTTDLLARLVGAQLRGAPGGSFAVDNRPGAIGGIGAAAVARAQPDGYTLLCTPSAPIVLSPLFNKALPYDPSAFEPIISLARSFFVVAVRKDFPAGSIAELIAYAKANPKKINYASGGTGSGSYLATALIARSAGVEMINIPYLGSAPAQQALVAGQVDLLIDSVGVLFSVYKAGLVKVLAIGAAERVPELAGIPTLAEAGLRVEDLSSWYGMFAPPRTPASIVAKLNRRIDDSLALPEVRAAVAALILQPTGGTQQSFADFLARDRGRWDKLAKSIAQQ
jgi:tripartite-type tricarboxylate transporter receptor subunit TctC